jgi:hypothetical protein
VKPVEGRAVREPHTMILLPDEGAEVRDDDPFWTRRLRDGDVERVEDPPPETLSGAAAGAGQGQDAATASGRAKPASQPHQPSAPAASGASKGD